MGWRKGSNTVPAPRKNAAHHPCGARAVSGSMEKYGHAVQSVPSPKMSAGYWCILSYAFFIGQPGSESNLNRCCLCITAKQCTDFQFFMKQIRRSHAQTVNADELRGISPRLLRVRALPVVSRAHLRSEALPCR
eukprot:scaffold3681_cov257-Pinguiococcus_pyrenoidosus.AAC.3